MKQRQNATNISYLLALGCCAVLTLGCENDARPDSSDPTDMGAAGAPASQPPVDIDELEGLGPLLSDVVHLAMSYRLVCATHADGRVSCWGEDYVRGLDGEPQRTPKLVEGVDDAEQVAVTQNAACAIVSNGTLSCWGAGPALSDAEPDSPEYTPPTPIAGLDNLVRVSSDLAHFCALDADGTVWCFGRDNPFSAGRATSNAEPLSVDNLPAVRDMAVTSDYGCQLVVLYESGSVECVSMSFDDGTNDEGEYVLSRRELDLENTSYLGRQCIVAGGRAHCFGNSAVLARSNEELDWSPDPVIIPNLNDVVQAWSGGGHACALDGSGRVFCWGGNRQGEIGQDYRSAVVGTPTEVPMAAKVTQIVTAENASCALLQSGNVMCWGGNGGVIGDGTEYTALYPVPVHDHD